MSIRAFVTVLVLAFLSIVQSGCKTSSPVSPLVVNTPSSWSTDSAGAPPYRHEHCSVVVNDRIYLLGGESDFGNDDNIRIFNADSDKWSANQDSWSKPLNEFSASVIGNSVYVIGGNNDNGQNTISPQVFDPGTGSWSTPPTNGHCVPRSQHTAAVVNGKIYLIGGISPDSSKWLTSVQIFDPATNTWSVPQTSGNFTARVNPTSCVINDKIYVFGGRLFNIYSNDSEGNNLEVFDPSTNAWTTPETIGNPLPRSGHTASVVNGKMYVIGGYSGWYSLKGYALQVDVFDPSTNIWSTPKVTGTFVGRDGLSSCEVNGKVYVIGGDNDGMFSDEESFFDVYKP